jgi:hypothetical protein
MHNETRIAEVGKSGTNATVYRAECVFAAGSGGNCFPTGQSGNPAYFPSISNGFCFCSTLSIVGFP